MAELSDEVLAKLVGFAKAQGIDLGVAPEGSEVRDTPPAVVAVNLNRAVSDIAHDTGMNLADSGLYRYGHRLVTVTAEGEVEDMEVDRFRSWVDRWQVNFYKRHKPDEEGAMGAPIRATLKRDVAAVLLASADFRDHLPELERVNPVPLPVWDGEAGVRLFPPGYDAETKTFTARGVEFPTDWKLRKGVRYLEALLGEFPFGDDGRSLAVQVAAMLTVFCQYLLPDRSRWPMIYYNANMPGSGKSRLAEMAIYPVYGDADTVSFSESEEFRKELDTWAIQRRAYTFIDDVGGLVKSNLLNKWLTMPRWSGRVMHSQRLFSVENRTLTLLTGNQATLSSDLARRCLVVDLWAAELAVDRQSRLTRVIDQEWLSAQKNRVEILAALYALVREWVHEYGARPGEEAMPSFEGWSRVVPAIVRAAGFACPLAPADLTDAAGKQDVEFQRMVRKAVETYGQDVDLRLNEWAAIAREEGLFYSAISDYASTREMMDGNDRLYKQPKDEDGAELSLREDHRKDQAFRYLDRSQSTKFANILHKYYRGRRVKVGDDWWQFAHREARHSTFRLERVIDAPAPVGGAAVPLEGD